MSPGGDHFNSIKKPLDGQTNPGLTTESKVVLEGKGLRIIHLLILYPRNVSRSFRNPHVE